MCRPTKPVEPVRKMRMLTGYATLYPDCPKTFLASNRAVAYNIPEPAKFKRRRGEACAPARPMAYQCDLAHDRGLCCARLCPAWLYLCPDGGPDFWPGEFHAGNDPAGPDLPLDPFYLRPFSHRDQC